jgi:hypothetical protein
MVNSSSCLPTLASYPALGSVNGLAEIGTGSAVTILLTLKTSSFFHNYNVQRKIRRCLNSKLIVNLLSKLHLTITNAKSYT